jgi:hypothetical protein
MDHGEVLGGFSARASLEKNVHATKTKFSVISFVFLKFLYIWYVGSPYFILEENNFTLYITLKFCNASKETLF